MNFKLTMTLVIILVLLSTLIFLLPNKPAEVKPPGTSTPVFASAPKELKSIAYTRDGQQQVALEKSGEAWSLTYPVKAAANSYDISPIADSLKNLAYKNKFDPDPTGGHSAEATGVAKPRYVVNFTDDVGTKHTLNLGKTTVGGIYATLDSDKTIYLLDGNPLETLNQDPQNFRNKSIKSLLSENITGITIKHPNQTVSLVKSADKWVIDSPISARANSTAVDEVLNEMKNINAEAFSDMTKDMPATGLTPPVATVTVLVANKSATPPAGSQPATAPAVTTTPTTLELGYYTDLTGRKNVYASLAGSGDVFTLKTDSFKKLNRELSDLRDPAVTPAPVANATDLSIAPADAAAPAIAMKKQGDQWTINSTTPPISGDSGEISTLLTSIANLRAIKFVDDAGDLKSIGLDPPQTKISLTIPGQSQQEVLLIGKPETADKVTPVMRQGEPTVYLVQTGEIEKITPPLFSLRDKTVENINANDVRSIAVTNLASPATDVTLTREGSTWSASQNGKNEKADDTKITTLLADFSPLTVKSYTSDFVNITGKPDMSVTITAAESNAPATAPAGLPSTAPIGPSPSHAVTRTLRLYKINGAWRALWDGNAAPQWSFEPNPALIDHLTTSYRVATTQPATEPASAPAQ